MEEVKTPPEGQDTGAEKSKMTKTVDEVVAELRAEQDSLTKRLKDQEAFIGKQSSEIGELRKRTPEAKVESVTSDELTDEITRDLKAEGLDEETARYNAKILSKSSVKVLDRKLNERMMHEVVDLVDEAMEEGKIDKKIFEENETDIMSEFKARKLAPTARKNYKIVRDCYEIVTKRKAEALRKSKEQEDGTRRDKDIAAGTPPPPGQRQVPDDEAKKVTGDILSAGPKRSSVFF